MQAAQEQQIPDFILQEDIDGELHAAVKHQHEEDKMLNVKAPPGVIKKP